MHENNSCLVRQTEFVLRLAKVRTKRKPSIYKATQGHTAKPEISMFYFTWTVFPSEWKTHVYHTGSSRDCRSIIEHGLLARGIGSRQGRQACYFSALNSTNKDAKARTKTCRPSFPIKVVNFHSCRREHDCIYHFSLNMQVKRLCWSATCLLAPSIMLLDSIIRSCLSEVILPLRSAWKDASLN